MPDAPTPLDLDAIRQRATQGYPFLGLWAACNDALVLIEEVKRLRDACKTLGGVIDRQCIDIAKIARSEHLVSDDGDADWGVIWEQAYEIADRAEKAEAEVAKLREKIDVDRAMHEAFRPEVVAEVAVLVCDEMDWQPVADWCGGTIGSTQDPSGEYTSSLTIPGVGSAGEGQWIVQRHDGTFAIRATLEGPSAESVARLTARPAPTWDEDAVVEGMARAVYPSLFTGDRQPLRAFGEARSDAELREGERDVARERMRQALAVVRDHQPVKPDRGALRVAHHRALMPQAMSIFAAVGGTQADYDALLDTLADAVLARFNITPKEDR